MWLGLRSLAVVFDVFFDHWSEGAAGEGLATGDLCPGWHETLEPHEAACRSRSCYAFCCARIASGRSIS